MQVSFYNSLRFKIGFGYIVLILINVGVTIWTIYNFGRLTTALTDILSKNYPTVIAVENMARAVERHDKAVRSLLNGDINNGKIELALAKEEFYQYLDISQEEITSELSQAILEDIQSTHAGYLLLIDSLQQLVGSGKFQPARLFHYDDILPFYQRLSDNCFWLIEENQKTMTLVSRQSKEIANDSVIAILSAAFLALLLSVVIIVQFTKFIILPAEKLTSTVNKIGRGQLDLKIDVQTMDEFGQLSREFNKMTERLRKFEAMNIEKTLLEKEKSETIVANLTDAIVVCDSDGKIQHINERAEKLFGMKKEKILGRSVPDLTGDSTILSIFQEKEKSAFVNQPFVELQVAGKPEYFYPRISPILTRYGEREGTVFILQDVTRFKELDKMKSDFMATVSHEFRTPVTSITMGVDILREHLLGPLNKQQEELLESFKQDCSRLTKLVRDLLQLSKLESDTNERYQEPINLKKLLTNVEAQVRLQFKEKGITLDEDIAESLPSIIADGQQLSWVVINLLNNALKYTDAGGVVKLKACRDNGKVFISVSDTGKGIPEEYLDKIFNKFVQVKHQNDTTPGSVGLGLSIAKDIVELYGGTISVESQLYKGSTFTVSLPIEEGMTA